MMQTKYFLYFEVYEGLVYMDFNADLIKQQGHGMIIILKRSKINQGPVPRKLDNFILG